MPGKTEGPAEQKWEEAIAAEVAKGKTRAQAVTHIASTRPELREAYVEEYNAVHASRPERPFNPAH